ncbi:unnamed protein product [Paramecium sonneborni]|uniref:Uncharacterized protein n=1 Tax=Paramecium sonneborni TaxID=65129 RepID=A0A8S1K6I7_9CILI|nr:unnamed protein product [Paramecium sonneborni]
MLIKEVQNLSDQKKVLLEVKNMAASLELKQGLIQKSNLELNFRNILQ